MTQDQLTYQGTLTVMRCWCGLRHAIPSELEAEQKRTGMTLHCPLGHTYIPADRAENTRLRAQLQQARAAAAATADAAPHQGGRLRSDEGAPHQDLLQFEQRSHGPGRSGCSKGLARHMETKHEDWPNPQR